MAIIKIGAPLSGIRGTVGGITFSANKAGPHARLWTPPSNPRTPQQARERSLVAKQPKRWNSLSDALKEDWADFAALPAQQRTNSLGETYYASGYNWFTLCNVRMYRVGDSGISAVPTQARPNAPTITEVRICPTGTESDQCICGTASASTEAPGFPATSAFDNNLTTYWSATAGTTTGYLRYYFCDPMNIKRYRIYGYGDYPTVNPKDWKLEVYTGGAWVTIHTVTGESWGAAAWHDFSCPNPYTETNYQLLISANQGHANYLSLVEMEMYLADVGYSVIIYPEDEFINSPTYCLILFVSMAPTEGRSVQYPGYYEIAATLDQGRAHHPFQDELETVFGTILLERKWFTRAHRQTQEGIRSPSTNTNVKTLGST